MIGLMKPTSTFAQSEIQDGDVICSQVEMSEKETHDLESQGLYSNPIKRLHAKPGYDHFPTEVR